jgi:hypothetical protein
MNADDQMPIPSPVAWGPGDGDYPIDIGLGFGNGMNRPSWVVSVHSIFAADPTRGVTVRFWKCFMDAG